MESKVEQRLTVITLGVNNIEVSRKFYSGILGWIPETDLDSIVFYDLGGYILALYEHKGLAEDVGLPEKLDLPPYHGFTLAYCTNSREEVDAIFNDLSKKGVNIVKDPQEVFWGGYSGYFLDPDGHAWEVAHNPSWMINNEGRIRRIASAQ